MFPKDNTASNSSHVVDGSFFHSMVEQAPVGIFVQTHGCFAYVNPATCSIFGASRPEDLQGLPVLERFHPDHQAFILEHIRRLNEARENVESGEYLFLRLDGSVGHARTSALPFVHEGANGALVFIRDITQEKLSQEALRAREELLQLTGRLAKVGGWDFDADTLQGTWTEEVARIHDLDPEGETNVELGLSFYKEESRKRIEAAIGKALADGEPYDLELEMVTPTGRCKWVRTKGFAEIKDGRVVRVRGIFQDISETKEAARLLASERTRLAVTLRSIGDGVITTDTRGLVTMLNPIAEELTGWRSEEACGKPLGEVFAILNEITRVVCEDPVAKVLKTGLVVELANHTCLISRDGRERSIADSGAPILDDDGNILGVVLVFRDMTEKHKLTESMHRAQSLESIGVLAGGIAHDFNNLLSGVFGNLGLALDASQDGDNDEVQRSLAKAMGIFERAKALTQQLLTFSKGGKPVRQVQRIDSLLRKSASFALSGSNVSASFRIDPDLWACDCDHNQLGQVIDNIVINAKQAMAEGGVVEVSANNTMLDPRPSDSANRRCPYVHIRISDHGEGIPREVISRIFDPFFSTKTTGHGLGLATVQSIVQRHDGWIDVSSEPGAGTTFDIHLPAHTDAPSSGGDSSAEPSRRKTRRGRILVMDDESYISEYLEVVLKSLGYSVVTASNGKDAVEAFRRSESAGTPFRLCILDLTIPGGMGGLATALEMRAIRPDATLVATSGYSDDPVVAEPDKHGFQDSLRKPFLKTDILAMLEHVLGHRSAT